MAITFQRHFVRRTKHSLVYYWLVSLLLLFSGNLAANSDSYQLDELSQLNHQEINNKAWQQIIANPSNKEQFFIINDTGQLYLLDETIVPRAALDLSAERLENAEQNNISTIKLTAITLHPSFSLRDQVGYATFYTAHLEPINKKSKTKRLQEHSTDLVLELDWVITEWQFNSSNYQQIDINTKREILRIAVPDKSVTIEQLSFNPSVKSWNDDFGLLYISLKGDKKWQKPLYSGVILRINPTKFGLRNFTVPRSNPFLKDSQIKDAIYLLGGQNIAKFIWPDKNSEQLLLLHQYNEKVLLSLTTGRDDWREQAPKKMLYQSDEAIDDLVMYRGRNLPYLRNKLLLLRYNDQRWQVDSLVFKRSLSASHHKANTPQLAWQFTPQQLSAQSEISLITNLSGEILLLDNAENLLYLLSQENAEIMVGAEQIIVENSVDDSSLILLLVVLVAGAFYYLVKRNALSAKTIVRQQYSQLEISESKQQIGLYRRHEKRAETMINIVDIVSSEVRLNEHSISLINHDEGHDFSQDKEQELQAIFTKEHADKMIEGKIRQITLQITDKKQSYLICLYMRKGSNRITKKNYFKVVDDLIDWCWLIGTKINSFQTDERKVKATVKEVESAKQVAGHEQITTSLHNQAAAIRPVTHKTSVKPKVQAKVTLKPTLRAANATNVQMANNKESTQKPLQASTVNANANKNINSTIDTELVNALEKLVNLKQEGFLTTEEFVQAKATLLKNLFDKS